MLKEMKVASYSHEIILACGGHTYYYGDLNGAIGHCRKHFQSHESEYKILGRNGEPVGVLRMSADGAERWTPTFLSAPVDANPEPLDCEGEWAAYALGWRDEMPRWVPSRVLLLHASKAGVDVAAEVVDGLAPGDVLVGHVVFPASKYRVVEWRDRALEGAD